MKHDSENPTGDEASARHWIVASNRLPIRIESNASGGSHFTRASGGLATALAGVSRERTFDWIGWPGAAVDEAERADVAARLEVDGLAPVFLDEGEQDSYYHGFCNAVLWPAFHYFLTLTEFDRSSWEAYRRVNLRFAEEIARRAAPGARVWLHDFHLMLVAKELRRLRDDLGIGFFLHIPFPSSEVYRLLPCREELLRGLLAADYISFHTHDYARHFRSACLRVLGVDSEPTHLDHDGRRVTIGVDPIGVDTEAFAQECAGDKAGDAWRALRGRYGDRKVVLGVERLDYTKGVLEKLRGFERFLESRPERVGEVTLLQLMVPSRLGHADYQQLKSEIEEEVGRINGRFGRPGFTPIEYLHRSVPRHELVAMYRIAAVGLVTPLRDGMNLVAQEYVLCQGARSRTMREGNGMLVLSEFAGAAHALSRSLLVNPKDTEQVAEAIEAALTMEGHEKRARMETMRQSVLALDCRRWAARFVDRMDAAVQVNELSRGRGAVAGRVRGLARRILGAERRRVLFLDYDGTLREIERRPELAAPTEEIRGLLRALAKTPGVDVRLVSGRSQAELDAWFSGLPLSICAEHGAATRDPGGQWERRADLELGWMPHVRRMLQEICRDVPGTFVEEKPAGLAWHYRLADPDYAKWRANGLLAQLSDDLAHQSAEVLPGRRVIEVRAMGVNKGVYAAEVARHAGVGATLVAIGDDRTDLDMYRALPPSAVTIHVGGSPEEARFSLESPAEVRALLGLLAGEETRERLEEGV